METRLEQQPRRQAAPHMRQTVMQAQAQRQADINEKVSVALEKLNGRMEMLENWRKEQDERRGLRPVLQRNDIAITISIVSLLVSIVLQHISLR